MSVMAIVGSRDFTNYDIIAKHVDDIIADNNLTITHIVSGGASGVDSLAKQYANKHNYQLVEYLPDWAAYGKAAGPMRNTLIINAADVCVAFPTANSRGTYDSIKKANAKPIPTWVIVV